MHRPPRSCQYACVWWRVMTMVCAIVTGVPEGSAEKALARNIPVAAAPRLDADAWTVAALDVLAAQGIDGVRVELLARNLGVTKGSFYWHFRDRDALHVAMLERWRRRATLDIIERLDRDEQPRHRFGALMRLPFSGPRSAHGADIELAIRLWGRRDPRARAALEEVDRLRTDYIAGLLTSFAVPAAEAQSRAVLAYCYMRVASTLIDWDDQRLMEQCEALLAGR